MEFLDCGLDELEEVGLSDVILHFGFFNVYSSIFVNNLEDFVLECTHLIVAIIIGSFEVIINASWRLWRLIIVGESECLFCIIQAVHEVGVLTRLERSVVGGNVGVQVILEGSDFCFDLVIEVCLMFLSWHAGCVEDSANFHLLDPLDGLIEDVLE